jgi:hypothetical protein
VAVATTALQTTGSPQEIASSAGILCRAGANVCLSRQGPLTTDWEDLLEFVVLLAFTPQEERGKGN